MPADFSFIDPTLLITVFIGIGLLSLLSQLRTRRFYLIRHGETLMNAEHVRQGARGALSPEGRAQGERVGRFLAPFPIRRIITSTYPRAQETAALIAARVPAPVITSELLVERRNPSEVIGKSTRDPEVIRITEQIDLAYHDDDYRFSDEETFAELKERAHRCLSLLAHQGSGDTVVVTHHVFLKMLVASMLYPDNLHASDFTKLSFFNYSSNAGVTLCEFYPWQVFSKTHGWAVTSFNEELPEEERKS